MGLDGDMVSSNGCRHPAPTDEKLLLRPMSSIGERFSKLWGAAAISNFGDGLMAAAIPLLMVRLTSDPLLVSGSVVAGTLPWFLFSLFSGAMVDRLDRKLVMVTVNVVRAGAVGGLAWTVATQTVSPLIIYVVAFALGSGETFFDTATEALVPNLVEKEHFELANGRMQSTELLGDTLIGPPAGALLFGVAAVAPFALNAASFVAAAILIGAIGGSYRPERVETQPILAEIKEGLSWLAGQKVVRSLALMSGAGNVLITGVLAVFVLYAKELLGLGEVAYGFFLSVAGLGAFVGALAASSLSKRLGVRFAISAILMLQSAVSLVFVLFPSPLPAAMAMFVLGFGVTALSVINITVRQKLTPDELRGRVASAVRMVAWGSQPIGALLGGILASQLGLRAPYFLAAVGWLMILILLNPTIEGELEPMTYVGRHRRSLLEE